MTYDAKELEQYPEIMNKEQLRKACHISKRTAHYLLQFNLIPHVCTGKKTRCYAIKKRDIIDFMINREVNPSRYIAPTGWYKYGNEDVKPYKIRIQPPLPGDPQKTRRYYESKLASYPDVIDVSAIVDFTDYNRHTVCEWIRFGTSAPRRRSVSSASICRTTPSRAGDTARRRSASLSLTPLIGWAWSAFLPTPS